MKLPPLLLLALLLTLGRPGQAQTTILAVAPALRTLTRIAPTPNYITRLKSPRPWKHFPLKVCFLRDANYAAARETMARNGFSKWAVAADGIIDFLVIADPREADIAVIFDPTTPNGLTRRGIDRQKRIRAVITIGARPGRQTDMEAIAAHEFGHALGIESHSPNRRDLMYPRHYEGTHGRPSKRDLNTMAALYPQIRTAIGQRNHGSKPVTQ